MKPMKRPTPCIGAPVFLALALTAYPQVNPSNHTHSASGTQKTPPPTGQHETVTAGFGRYHITIDTSDTPDLTQWARTKLAPVVRKWYPKIVKMLPSKGFKAPRQFTIVFRNRMRGVAGTSGSRIVCGAPWFRRSLEGEARGAVVHEMVHVVQDYGWARRRHPDATRPPGWLVEGIADYIRWYHYEPQSHGAEISRRALPRVRYNASYRPTANFLNWVSQTRDKHLVRQLNAAIRDGQYNEELWQKLTGRTLPALGDAWKAALAKKLGVKSGA
jgi:Peptidase of plants and bacteria